MCSKFNYSIIQSLLETEYDVLKLRDYIPTDSSDSDVISIAQELDTILISLNGDFADIVMFPPSKFNGIIAIQVRNHSADNGKIERLSISSF